MTIQTTPVQDRITQKLSDAFSPEHLEVVNESHRHNVPEGSESHFKVVIVSDAFKDKMLIARHRLVNKILEDELKQEQSAGGIHALALHTMTMEECFKKGNTPESPECMGGNTIN
jgi:BolA protein